jgi:hypothetical protein
MTDKSVFSDDEWRAIVDAPLRATMAMFAAGEHGPISMVKEASASARAIARPGDRGAAGALIAQISSEAEGREARHDVKAHHGQSMDTVADTALSELQPAAAALRKLPDVEAAEVAGWLVDIARAVAGASKGVSDKEQATIDKIAAMFKVTGDEAPQT